MVKNPFRQSTPEASEIHGMLREMVEAGRQYAVVEATSHGLSERMNRLADVEFDAAVLTNVTHEHLEFHGTFEQYRSDKANLFRALDRTSPKATCGKRSPSARRGRERGRSQRRVLSGQHRGAVFVLWHDGAGGPERAGSPARTSPAVGSCFAWEGREARGARCHPGTLLGGKLAGGVSDRVTGAGAGPAVPCAAAPGLRCVQGRMDYVDLGQPFAVIVDYAHTPGAFEKLFPWVREHTSGRITAVFGSAGERDREKRRMQGRVASRALRHPRPDGRGPPG